VQDAFAGIVAPVGLPNVSVVAPAAGAHVGVPPHVVDAAGVAATWTPVGSASVKVTPVRGAVVVGLFKVKVSVDVPLTAIGLATNAFVMVGFAKVQTLVKVTLSRRTVAALLPLAPTAMTRNVVVATPGATLNERP